MRCTQSSCMSCWISSLLTPVMSYLQTHISCRTDQLTTDLYSHYSIHSSLLLCCGLDVIANIVTLIPKSDVSRMCITLPQKPLQERPVHTILSHIIKVPADNIMSEMINRFNAICLPLHSFRVPRREQISLRSIGIIQPWHRV